MKTAILSNVLLSLVWAFQLQVFAEDRHVVDIPFHQGAYNLNEIEFLTKNLNYEVQKNAFKAYEAKEMVTLKMSAFLPSLNFNNMLNGFAISMPRPVGPWQYTYFGEVPYVYRGQRANVGRVENLFRNGLIATTFLGFMFPSNWYDFAKSKKIHKAEKLSFEAMLANQISAVKDLYLNIHLIKSTRNSYKRYIGDLNEFISWINDIAELYGFNQIEESYTRLIQYRDELERQARMLEEKYQSSLLALGDVAGIPEDFMKKFDIVDVEIPQTFRRFTEAEKNLFEKITLHSSREIQNYAELVLAAEDDIGARRWAFFHPNSIMESNLGFGYMSYVEIGKAERRKTLIESKEVLESIRTGIQVAFISHDTTLDLIEKNSESFEKVKAYQNDIQKKFSLGQMSLSQLIEAKRTNLERVYFFDLLLQELRHEALATEQKITRLTWQGESFKNLQKFIPEKLEKNDWWQREEIIGNQAKKGYKVSKLNVLGKQFPEGRARFVNGLIFPKIEGFTYGDWDVDRKGVIKMHLMIDGKNYSAKGRVYRTRFGKELKSKFLFASRVQMDLEIFDEALTKVGSVHFED